MLTDIEPVESRHTHADVVEIAALAEPSLTTVHVPSATMGENAADFLVAQIPKAPIEPPVEIKTTLMVRDTTAAPRNKPGAG